MCFISVLSTMIMSNAEPIVVSLEMAKKLKEAGFPDEPLLAWFCVDPAGGWGPDFLDLNTKGESDFGEAPITKLAGAWTAEEILRRLPDNYRLGFVRSTFDGKEEKQFQAYCADSDRSQYADTLANAAAAMWIYLKEHHLLPPEK
ncbi:MAG: lysozyme [Siphoviridae sp. ctpQM7]|nr:MAG: lysozyme [Siphoviridae sp. ctpQM7]